LGGCNDPGARGCAILSALLVLFWLFCMPVPPKCMEIGSMPIGGDCPALGPGDSGTPLSRLPVAGCHVPVDRRVRMASPSCRPALRPVFCLSGMLAQTECEQSRPGNYTNKFGPPIGTLARALRV
jgi:hypothetical protein